MPDLSQRVREINSAKTTTRKVTAEKTPARRGRPPKKATATTTKKKAGTIKKNIVPPEIDVAPIIPTPPTPTIVKVSARQARQIQKEMDKTRDDDWSHLANIVSVLFHAEWMVIGVLALVLIAKLIFGN